MEHKEGGVVSISLFLLIGITLMQVFFFLFMFYYRYIDTYIHVCTYCMYIIRKDKILPMKQLSIQNKYPKNKRILLQSERILLYLTFETYVYICPSQRCWIHKVWYARPCGQHQRVRFGRDKYCFYRDSGAIIFRVSFHVKPFGWQSG